VWVGAQLGVDQVDGGQSVPHLVVQVVDNLLQAVVQGEQLHLARAVEQEVVPL